MFTEEEKDLQDSSLRALDSWTYIIHQTSSSVAKSHVPVHSEAYHWLVVVVVRHYHIERLLIFYIHNSLLFILVNYFLN